MDGTSVDFALTRFEAVDGTRLEVEGTWSGVRGMRFVRPALVVHRDGAERTLLALLEDKPWPAEDGRPWRATFPWDGGELDPGRTELAVAPSIVVPLGGPDDDDRDADPQTVLRHRLAEAEERRRRLEAEVGFLRREREELVAPEVVRRDHEAVEAARRAALAERDAAVAARQAALAERDEARTERDRLAAERDAALADRDAARREVADRERQAQGSAQRREQALHERDAARRERAETATQQRMAEQEREAAARERERVAGELQATRAELEAAEAEREQALAQPAGMVPRRVRPERSHARHGTRADWAARAAAILAVLILLLLVITFLKVL